MVSDAATSCPRCGLMLPGCVVPPGPPQYADSHDEQPYPDMEDMEERPKPYLTSSIVLLCLSILRGGVLSLAFSIAAVVYASRVDGLWIRGFYEEACHNASKARKFFYVSLVFLLLLPVGLVIALLISLLVA